MLYTLSIMWVSFLLVGNVSSARTKFKYFFKLTPNIRSNSNWTFVLTTTNNSPTDSFFMSFSILDILNNKTIASVTSKEISPGSTGDQEVTLQIPQKIFCHPYALHSRSFRLRPSSYSPKLVTEKFHRIQGDLRNSTILIFLDKASDEYLYGDKVHFTVLLLDRQLKPFHTKKVVSISIWKNGKNKYEDNMKTFFKHWPSVTIHPEKPFVTGNFLITQTAIEDPYEILVTLDERSDDDLSHVDNLTCIQSIFPEKLLSKKLFYSFETKSIEPDTSLYTPSPEMNLVMSISPSFVTLKDPEFVVEANATNSLGYPVRSGVCKVQDQVPSRCAIADLRQVSFTEGRISFKVNSTQLINPKCLKQIFEENSSFCFKLGFNCQDIELQEETHKTSSQVCLTETDILISHMFIEAPIPTLLFLVTGKEGLPLTEKNTAGNSLEVSYVFYNQSKVSVNESILYGGIAEHSLNSLVDHFEVSHLQISFKDLTLNISKCDGCPEKVYTKQSESWLTSPQLESQTYILTGQPVEIAVPSESPFTYLRVLLCSLTGEYQETLQQVNISRNTTSRFVTFVTLLVPPNIQTAIVNDDLVLSVVCPNSPPVLLDDISKQEILVAPPNTAGSIKVFGIGIKPVQFIPKVINDQKWKYCTIAKPPGTKPCKSIHPTRILKHKTINKPPKAPFDVEGAVEISAQLNLDENSQKWSNGWLWNSSSTTSDSLSIRTSIPLGLSKKQKLYGILVDDIQGIRITQPVNFDPKSPFVLHARPVNPRLPQIQRFTIINYSNTRITQVNFHQTDHNKLLTFEEFPGVKQENFTLKFNVFPHSSDTFDKLYTSNVTGVANLIVVSCFDGNYSAVETSFDIRRSIQYPNQ